MKEGGDIRWLNILGAPKNASDSAEAMVMNRVPQEASVWKGRCLVHLKFEDVEAPKIDTKRFEEFEAYNRIVGSEDFKHQTQLSPYFN